MTLEALLGIPPNANNSPDYKGIELKASRIDDRRSQKNKLQLFSKVPKWQLSPIRSAKELILNRGYTDQNGSPALRHTISGDRPNSLGLYLDVDYANDYLRQMFMDPNAQDFKPLHDTTWVLQDLRKALRRKHKETFWVKALHNHNRADEHFHYVKAEHTVNPFIEKMETLIETGLITVDYTMHIRDDGSVRDHGYLFKLGANGLGALFPPPIEYDLTV